MAVITLMPHAKLLETSIPHIFTTWLAGPKIRFNILQAICPGSEMKAKFIVGSIRDIQAFLLDSLIFD
jgi:hypothetical protein